MQMAHSSTDIEMSSIWPSARLVEALQHNASFCCERTGGCRAARRSVVRSPAASRVRPAHVASEWPATRGGEPPRSPMSTLQVGAGDGVPARPESSLRQATATRRGADRTTRDAGRRATDGRKTDKDPTWTARRLVARREESRHTATTPIETPIAILEHGSRI